MRAEITVTRRWTVVSIRHGVIQRRRLFRAGRQLNRANGTIAGSQHALHAFTRTNARAFVECVRPLLLSAGFMSDLCARGPCTECLRERSRNAALEQRRNNSRNFPRRKHYSELRVRAGRECATEALFPSVLPASGLVSGPRRNTAGKLRDVGARFYACDRPERRRPMEDLLASLRHRSTLLESFAGELAIFRVIAPSKKHGRPGIFGKVARERTLRARCARRSRFLREKLVSTFARIDRSCFLRAFPVHGGGGAAGRGREPRDSVKKYRSETRYRRPGIM